MSNLRRLRKGLTKGNLNTSRLRRHWKAKLGEFKIFSEITKKKKKKKKNGKKEKKAKGKK